ncbi:MAG: serine/threonine-protein kinase, partial [Myxococcota bacterium]
MVQIFDFIRIGNRMAMELEFINGLTLREVFGIANKYDVRIPPGFSLAVIIQVLNALQYLKYNGIIHRDIKPGNMFVDRSGVSKVADFGVAHIPTYEMTENGMMPIGTYTYLPPEAFTGQESANHSWDIWGCSVVLWELLAQRRLLSSFMKPGKSLNQLQTINALRVFEPTEASKVCKDVSPELSAVICTALQRDPFDRFQSADHFRQALLDVTRNAVFGAEDIRRFVVSLSRIWETKGQYKTDYPKLSAVALDIHLHITQPIPTRLKHSTISIPLVVCPSSTASGTPMSGAPMSSAIAAAQTVLEDNPDTGPRSEFERGFHTADLVLPSSTNEYENDEMKAL